MSRALAADEVELRIYREKDETRVLELLAEAFGSSPVGDWSPEFFRWKHLASPFGPSLMVVAETEGRVVGFRAFMPWRLRAGGRLLHAVRGADVATHPDFRGMGLLVRMTRRALAALSDDVELVFTHPNKQSVAAARKLGWVIAGRLPVSVRVRRPVRFARRLPSVRRGAVKRDAEPDPDAQTAADALHDSVAVSTLLGEMPVPGHRLRTSRDLAYLRWRYASPMLLGYRAVSEQRAGGLGGLAIFRLHRRGDLWESTVAEVIVRPGDRRTARCLLRQVIAAAPVDYLTCRFTASSSLGRAAWQSGFLPSRLGPRLAVHPLRDVIDPEPTEMSSWDLSLGDLEFL
jgi:GNAT superfamily N-acetyltransferase